MLPATYCPKIVCKSGARENPLLAPPRLASDIMAGMHEETHAHMAGRMVLTRRRRAVLDGVSTGRQPDGNGYLFYENARGREKA